MTHAQRRPPDIGQVVWKYASRGGYEGPGKVVATFKNWMGQPRYVVEHHIEGGRGCFYHIYSLSELSPPDGREALA